MSTLRDALQAGFPVGLEQRPWGTLLDAVVPGPLEHGRYRVLGPFPGQLGPVPTGALTLVGPGARRPVTAALYGLDAALSLHTEAGRRPVVEALEALLGPGVAEDRPVRGHAAHAVAHTVGWALGGVSLSLSCFGAERAEPWGSSSGLLSVHGEDEVLAAPFLAAWRGPRPWHEPAGRLEVLPAPGLSQGPSGQSDARLCLWSPHRLPAPPWVQVGPEQVGLWTHEQAGAWGIVAGRLGVVFEAWRPVRLRLVRLRPARGPGAAFLDLGTGGGVLDSGPGCTGLDAVAERLSRHPDVRLDVHEEPDA